MRQRFLSESLTRPGCGGTPCDGAGRTSTKRNQTSDLSSTDFRMLGRCWPHSRDDIGRVL